MSTSDCDAAEPANHASSSNQSNAGEDSSVMLSSLGVNISSTISSSPRKKLDSKLVDFWANKSVSGMDESSVRGTSFYAEKEGSSSNILSTTTETVPDQTKSDNSCQEAASNKLNQDDTSPSNQSISVLRAASFYNEQISSNAAAANVVNNSNSKLNQSSTISNQSISALDIRTASFFLQGAKEVPVRKLPSHRLSFQDSSYQNSILASMQEDAQSQVNRSKFRNQSSNTGTSYIGSSLSQSTSALNSSTDTSTSNISQPPEDHPGSSLGSNSILSTSRHSSSSPMQKNRNRDKQTQANTRHHSTTTNPIPKNLLSTEQTFLSARKDTSFENQSPRIVHSPNRISSIPKSVGSCLNLSPLPNPSHFDTPDRPPVTRELNGRNSPGQIRSYYESASEGDDDTPSPGRIESQILEQRHLQPLHSSNGSQAPSPKHEFQIDRKQDEEDIMDLTSIHSDGAASDCQHDVSVADLNLIKLNNHLQSLELSAIAVEMSCNTEDEQLPCEIPTFRRGVSTKTMMIDTGDDTASRNRPEFSGNAIADAICAADAAVTEIRKTDPSSFSHSSYDLNLMQIDNHPISPVYYSEMNSPGGSTYVHSNVVGSTPVRSNYRQITAIAADAEDAPILSSRIFAATGRPKGALLHPSPRYYSPRLETADEREEDLHVTSVNHDTELSLGTSHIGSLQHTSESRVSTSSLSNISRPRQRNRKSNHGIVRTKEGSKRGKRRSLERRRNETGERSFDSTYSGSSSGDLNEYTAELSLEGLLHAFMDMISPEDERSLYTIGSESADSDCADDRRTPTEGRSTLWRFRQMKEEDESGFSQIQNWLKKELVSAVVKDVSSTVYAAKDESKDFSDVEELLNTEIQRVLSGEAVTLFGSKHNSEEGQNDVNENADDPLNQPHLQWLKSLKNTLDEAQERTFVCSVPETKDIDNEIKNFDALDELAQAIRFANLSKSRSAVLTPRLRSFYEKWIQASNNNLGETESSRAVFQESSSCVDSYSKGVNLGDSLDLFTIDELTQPMSGQNKKPTEATPSQPVNEIHIKYQTPENSILDNVVDISPSKSQSMKDAQTALFSEACEVDQNKTVDSNHQKPDGITTGEKEIYSPVITATILSQSHETTKFSDCSETTRVSGSEKSANVAEKHGAMISEVKCDLEIRNSFDQAPPAHPTIVRSTKLAQPQVSLFDNAISGENFERYDAASYSQKHHSDKEDDSLSSVLHGSGEIELADDEFSVALDKFVPGAEKAIMTHQVDSVVHQVTLSKDRGTNIDFYRSGTGQVNEGSTTKLRFPGKHASEDNSFPVNVSVDDEAHSTREACFSANASTHNTHDNLSEETYSERQSSAHSPALKTGSFFMNASRQDKSNFSKTSSISYDSIHEVNSLPLRKSNNSKAPSLSNDSFHEMGFLPQDSTILKSSLTESSSFHGRDVLISDRVAQSADNRSTTDIKDEHLSKGSENSSSHARDRNFLASTEQGETSLFRSESVTTTMPEAELNGKRKTKKKKRRLPKIHILTNVQGGTIHNSSTGVETIQCHDPSEENTLYRLGNVISNPEVSHECNLTQFGQEWTQDQLIDRSISRREPDSISFDSQPESSAENNKGEPGRECETLVLQFLQTNFGNNDSGLTHFGQEWECELGKKCTIISDIDRSLDLDQVPSHGKHDTSSGLAQSSTKIGYQENVQKSSHSSAPSNIGIMSLEIMHTGLNDSILSNNDTKALKQPPRAKIKKNAKSPHVLMRIGKINFMKKRLGYRNRPENHPGDIVAKDSSRQQATEERTDIEEGISSISRRLFVQADDECRPTKNHEASSQSRTGKSGNESLLSVYETKPGHYVEQFVDDKEKSLKLRRDRSRHEIKVEKEKKSRKKRNTVESLLEIKDERFNFLSKSKKLLDRQRSLPLRSATDIFNDVLFRSLSDNPATESDADLSLPFHNISVEKAKQNETAETVKLSFNHSSEWEEFSTGFGGNIWDTSTSKSPAKRSYLPTLPRTPEEFNTSDEFDPNSCEKRLYSGPVLI